MSSNDEAYSGFFFDAPVGLPTNFYLMMGQNSYGFINRTSTTNPLNGDIDTYAIHVNIGSSYSILGGGATIFGGTAVDPHLILLNASGTPLIYSASNGTYDTINFVATASTYYLEAYTYQTSAGYYGILINNNSSGKTSDYGGALSAGVIYSGAISFASDEVYYNANLQAGHTYAFQLSTNVSNLYLNVTYGATLGVTSGVANGNGVYTFSPTVSGIYALWIGANDFYSTGNYTFIGYDVTNAPIVSVNLVSDTGASSSDKITSNGSLSGSADPTSFITIKENNTTLGSVTSNSSGIWSFIPTLQDGIHNLTISETDLIGNVGSASISYTLDTTSPILNITSSAGSANQASQTVTGTISVSDRSASVLIYDGANLIGSATPNTSGAWLANVTLSSTQGTHLVTAKATDAAGNTGSSTSVSYVFNSLSPPTGVTVAGTSGNDNLTGSNAVFWGGPGNDSITGLSGTNSVLYSGQSLNYTLSINKTSITLQDRTGAEGTDTLANIQNINFSDKSLSSSWFTKTASLNSSQIVDLVELYIASFNRAPDAIGLNYWGSRLFDGMSLQDIAKSFFEQPETISAYPANMADSNFVTKIYNNVLNRAPDSQGLDYWLGEIKSGHVTRDSFMITIINGARAATGSLIDQQTLANKELVGAHYALNQGLSDTLWASNVMANVSNLSSSVNSANTLSDSYLVSASGSQTPELIVKLLGVAA